MTDNSFIVIDGDLRLKMHKGPSGMYVAASLDVFGLFTQGRTVEETIANAHDAAKTLAESRAIMARETARSARAVKLDAANPRKRQLAKA